MLSYAHMTFGTEAGSLYIYIYIYIYLCKLFLVVFWSLGFVSPFFKFCLDMFFFFCKVFCCEGEVWTATELKFNGYYKNYLYSITSVTILPSK